LFSPAHLAPLKRGTIVILVIDTDTDDSSFFQRNISFLKRRSAVKDVFCIPQVANLEEELIRSCSIRSIKELLSSKSNSDFKNDLCSCHGLPASLLRHDFDITKFWSSKPTGKFSAIPNDSDKIKRNP